MPFKKNQVYYFKEFLLLCVNKWMFFLENEERNVLMNTLFAKRKKNDSVDLGGLYYTEIFHLAHLWCYLSADGAFPVIFVVLRCS
jgi:hypothetical protein